MGRRDAVGPPAFVRLWLEHRAHLAGALPLLLLLLACLGMHALLQQGHGRPRDGAGGDDDGR